MMNKFYFDAGHETARRGTFPSPAIVSFTMQKYNKKFISQAIYLFFSLKWNNFPIILP